MLSKVERISRETMKSLLTSRKYAHSAYFSLRMAAGEGVRAAVSNRPRFAVSVSKKVSRKAVIRNRTRRRAYAALKTLQSSIDPGLYLIIAKPGAENLKGEALVSELKGLMRLRS